MTLGLEPVELPADAVEVARVQGAWGIKGWFKILPYSACPQALFSCKRWFLLPPENAPKAAFAGVALLKIRQAREHAGAVIANAHEIGEREAAEALKGARIFVPRSSFPTPAEGEYYWVDLIGLDVVNRQGVALGRVTGLLETGAQQVLALGYEQDGQQRERLIPFVDAYVDRVDLDARQIVADWQPDY